MWILDWLFKKQRTPSGHIGSYTGFAAPKDAQETYLVTFEQMRKGAITRRGRKKVRQCAVMVGSDLRLVTSGDHVPRDTYLAMCKFGYLELPEAEREVVLEMAETDLIDAPLPPVETPSDDDAADATAQDAEAPDPVASEEDNDSDEVDNDDTRA